jgi:hypothetical protein
LDLSVLWLLCFLEVLGLHHYHPVLLVLLHLELGHPEVLVDLGLLLHQYYLVENYLEDLLVLVASFRLVP